MSRALACLLSSDFLSASLFHYIAATYGLPSSNLQFPTRSASRDGRDGEGSGKVAAICRLKGACLVEGHALHLAGKNAYSSCDGEPATTQSLRASEFIKDTGRIFILPDRN